LGNFRGRRDHQTSAELDFLLDERIEKIKLILGDILLLHNRFEESCDYENKMAITRYHLARKESCEKQEKMDRFEERLFEFGIPLNDFFDFIVKVLRCRQIKDRRALIDDNKDMAVMMERLIFVLRDSHQLILNLLYGFNGKERHSFRECSEMENLPKTRGALVFIHNTALFSLLYKVAHNISGGMLLFKRVYGYAHYGVKMSSIK
jgi:hypothetical protein